MEAVELKAHQPSNREAEIITQKRTGKLFLDKIVHEVQQGNIPATFAALQIKQLEKEFKSSLRQIEEQAKDELVGTGVYVYGDYQIKAREGSVTFNYSECEEVMLMEQHLKEMKEKYKSASKGVETGITIVLENHCFVDSSGQICNLPKIEHNKSSIVLTKIGRG